MRLRCRCGHTMNNVASPGHVVHHLLTEYGVEQLWGAADRDVSETVGHRECWLCPECGRLYVGLDGPHSAVRVYTPEAVGIDPADTWADMYILPTGQVWLGPKPADPGAAPNSGPLDLQGTIRDVSREPLGE